MSEVFAQARERVSAKGSLFLAAVFYGSVASGEHTLFSDLDWYVVIDPACDRKARRVIARIRHDAAERHVISHACVLTPEDILVQPTLFGPSFLPLWNQLRERGLVFGNPERFASDRFASVQEEMHYRVSGDHAAVVAYWQQLFRKTREIHPSVASDRWVEQFVRKTRRTRTRPLHFYWKVARVLLCWRDGELSDPSKPSVFSAMFDDRRFRVLLPQFSELRLIEEEYSHLFAQARVGGCDKVAYYKRLGELITWAMPLVALLHERSFLIVQSASPLSSGLARRRAAA